MIAWVAARMDPGFYGERIAFQFPTGTSTQGPVQIEARINADDAITEQFTLWSNAGSQVVRGNLLVLPIGEDALIYVEPIFLQAQGAPFPEFVRVIMADQDRVAFAETVEDGLAQLLGEAEPPPPEEPGAIAVAGRVAGASPSPTPGELPADFDSAGRRGAAALRRGAGRAGRRRPRHVPGANRRARRGARRTGRWPGSSRPGGGGGASRPSDSRSRSGRPRARIRRPRARAGLAAGPRRGSALRANAPRATAGRRRSARTCRARPDRPTAVARHAARERYELVVIGPERPWRPGSRTSWRQRGSPTFGPTRAAARLESSKAFAKQQMERAGVATAASATFTDPDAALRPVRSLDRPPVVKADWLAAGKGVVVPETVEEAEAAVRDLFAAVRAGARVVLEERLEGLEVSAFALVSDATVVPLAAARDYKRFGDGTPARTPAAWAPSRRCRRSAATRSSAAAAEVFEPIAWRMARDGAAYRGCCTPA